MIGEVAARIHGRGLLAAGMARAEQGQPHHDGGELSGAEKAFVPKRLVSPDAG
jgi:hypothetical protein